MRKKLQLTLVVFPSIFLGLFLVFNVSLLREDKLAYVLESSLNQSQFLASKVESEILRLEKSILPIVEGINHKSKKFDRISRSIFNKNKFLLKVIILDEESLKSWSKMQKEYSKLDLKQALNTYNLNEKLTIIDSETAIYKKRIKTSTQRLLVLAEVSNSFYTIGDELISDIYSYKIVSIKDKKQRESQGIISHFLNKVDFSINSAGKILDYNNDNFIISYDKVSDTTLMALSITKTDDVLRAFKDLLIRSLMFFIALICTSFLLAYFISRRMTLGVAKLSDITQKIADGDFELKEAFPFKDEFGTLFKRFKVMAREIKKLLEDTKQKARMENELKNAKIYQSFLIPPSDYEDSHFKIKGLYNPASECSGDWWFYKTVDNYFYAGIGDVTGHGVASALLTSAAKATLENLMDKDITLDVLVKKMNYALYKTTQGKLNMTFFVYRYNLDTGVFEYSNASHDPAAIFRKKDGKYDFLFLDGKSCERLASIENIEPTVSTFKLEKDDLIFLWTDGITELRNPKGRSLGEKKLHKFIVSELEKNNDVQSIVSELYTKLDTYSNSNTSDDDITYFFTKVK